MTVETEEVLVGFIGWIANDDNQFWLQNLIDVALRLIFIWVQVEAPRPGTMKAVTLTKPMGTFQFAIPENKDWPELNPLIEDPTIFMPDNWHAHVQTAYGLPEENAAKVNEEPENSQSLNDDREENGLPDIFDHDEEAITHEQLESIIQSSLEMESVISNAAI
jgi:hypothetical protein